MAPLVLELLVKLPQLRLGLDSIFYLLGHKTLEVGARTRIVAAFCVLSNNFLGRVHNRPGRDWTIIGAGDSGRAQRRDCLPYVPNQFWRVILPILGGLQEHVVRELAALGDLVRAALLQVKLDAKCRHLLLLVLHSRGLDRCRRALPHARRRHPYLRPRHGRPGF